MSGSVSQVVMSTVAFETPRAAAIYSESARGVIANEQVAFVGHQQDSVRGVAQERQAVFTPSVESIRVVGAGNQGAAGRDGLAAEGAVGFPFSWGDATPAFIGSFEGVVVSVSIVILEAFNGVNPTLTVTAAGYPILMEAGQNIPEETGRYEANPSVRLTAPTTLSLNINAGSGASAGNGIVYLETADE